MSKHVIILGGGVAGMSAAHELIERGFRVTVFERQKTLCGGKARSIPIPETASPGKDPLPGEHGFRFFPGFYRHIIDTMERIPVSGDPQAKFVTDNLRNCPNMMMARKNQIPIILPNHLPRSLKDLAALLKKMKGFGAGLESGESALIAKKLWQLLTSCEERRFNEYERTGWWEFTEAATHSEAYRTVFVTGLTRTLVAAKAETCNTKTNGDILIQMMINMTAPFVNTDRILCGPTNEKWLDPWLKYLQEKKVAYEFNCEAVALNVTDRKIASVTIKRSGKEEEHSADYFLCAIPVERAAVLLNTKPLLKLDPNLSFTKKLSDSVAWMNGMQFYLKKDVPLVDGHIILADSEWSLTAISQAQFWNINLEKYGRGDVAGILSVDVSNWEVPGPIFHKPASQCTKKEALLEVWEQLKSAFNTPDIQLEDSNLVMAYVDEDIIFGSDLTDRIKASQNPEMNKPAPYGSNRTNKNEEPLLVNEINTWSIRNDSRTSIANLFLASDYVRTFTDLATMEGANEAARRATNDIIDVSGSKQSFCKVWNLHEPGWLLFYKWQDKRRYNLGLAWKLYEPWYAKLINYILYLFKR